MMKKDFYNKKMPVSKAKNVVDKKAEMRNKIYAYILCGLFVFWTIASVLGIVSFVRTSEKSAGVEMVMASAETIDQIETFPQYYAKIPEGTVWSVGYGTAASYHSSGRLNFERDSTTFFMVQIAVSFGSKNSLYSDSLLFASVYDLTVVEDFYFSVPLSDLSFTKVLLYLNNTTTYLTCSLTEFEVIAVNGGGGASQEELDEAYNNGYADGLDEGMGIATAGFFYGAVASGTIEGVTNTDGDEVSDIVFSDYSLNDYIAGGINLKSLGRYLDENNNVEWSKTKLSILLRDPVPYNEFVLRGFGVSTSFLNAVTLHATNGLQYSFDWVRDDLYSSYVLNRDDVVSNNILIDRIALSFGGGVDGFDFSLYTNVEYDSGFSNGYNKGYGEGEMNGIKVGKDLGFSDGKAVGYKEGVAAANDYTFDGLLTAIIDVPVQAFTSLFNFEILGVNLASFFLALLSICIVLAVVKLLI